MDQDRIDRLRPVYKLWREYLKRSDLYSELCDHYRRRQQDPSTPFPDKLQGSHNILAAGGLGLMHPTVFVYWCFRDVHTVPFDQWWDQYLPELSAVGARKQARGVISDYAEMIEADIDKAVSLFEQEKGRQPTIQELKDQLVREMNIRQWLGVRFYEVNYMGHTAKDIVASFNSVVDAVKSDPIHMKKE